MSAFDLPITPLLYATLGTEERNLLVLLIRTHPHVGLGVIAAPDSRTPTKAAAVAQEEARQQPPQMMSQDTMKHMTTSELRALFVKEFQTICESKKTLQKALWQLLVFRNLASKVIAKQQRQREQQENAEMPKSSSEEPNTAPYLAGFCEMHRKLEEAVVRQSHCITALLKEMEQACSIISERGEKEM